MSEIQSLPLVLAGPILRKSTTDELVLWLVTREPIHGSFQLFAEADQGIIFECPLSNCKQLQIGQNAHVILAQFKGSFPADVALSYEFVTQDGKLSQLQPEMLYADEVRPIFRISTRADYLLHGSCRNPHHPAKDALVQADLKVSQQALQDRPDMLLMSGDQIYADHVAGPMLDAIHQVCERLGLRDEAFAEAPIKDSAELLAHQHCYYQRDQLLPSYNDESHWLNRLLLPKHTPIFSSRECENHLITFSEFIAMYLLVWSPALWRCINIDRLEDHGFTHGGQPFAPVTVKHWRQEKQQIENFIAGLNNASRLMAHIPTYMIFDDHDVTDDWNLTVGWEKAAYDNRFAKRIIGNGLLAYWLCQGWGNEPDNFPQELWDLTDRFIDRAGEPKQSTQAHDDLIQYLYSFENWHYTIHSSPKVVVLDTRTRRWRSESRMNKPSGLMDWEALIEFQQELMHQDKVVVVSAAPMFGVKFIEALQKSMTMLRQPLLIDAENWMAHPGSANTLLSIFTHTKTPTNFVILSGDVHYSFAYDIKLRFRKSSPNIYQITCSGFKNQFPEPLLGICDRIDRAIYSPRSPLNYLTKRKRLKVFKRDPDTSGSRRLVNSSAVGELKLDPHGKPSEISILTGEGNSIHFPPTQESL
ncbi:alkaline phosphatase family protein [Vibrio sp. 404]|uniref:Alkaline phosphatase family protein n=1 Tax=Vibrio marinisediminis TaxID=2758441 RepID=A0A7W2FP34_9VIBR|nr:alkaline phosphatase family protein [Vibrio marinisediminis]MBA5761668.1 alkaline phosphatase family protein [Vibrio marinisediminis]